MPQPRLPTNLHHVVCGVQERGAHANQEGGGENPKNSGLSSKKLEHRSDTQ